MHDGGHQRRRPTDLAGERRRRVIHRRHDHLTAQDAGAVYICIQPHTADATQNQPGVGVNWNSYWQLAANQLTVFTDQGLYIADGQRVLRVDANGAVDRQTNGTQGYDPQAQAVTSGPNTSAAGLVQQDFTLLTRVHQLPNGDTLVCDTGGNRVVQFDHTGTITWQYPDSDLTYQDPDRLYGASADTPARGAALAALQIPTQASLRISDPRDVRRYVHDVSYTLAVTGASRNNNIVTLTVNAIPNIFGANSLINITVQGVRTNTAGSNFNGQFVGHSGEQHRTLQCTQQTGANDTALAGDWDCRHR